MAAKKFRCNWSLDCSCYCQDRLHRIQFIRRVHLMQLPLHLLTFFQRVHWTKTSMQPTGRYPLLVRFISWSWSHDTASRWVGILPSTSSSFQLCCVIFCTIDYCNILYHNILYRCLSQYFASLTIAIFCITIFCIADYRNILYHDTLYWWPARPKWSPMMSCNCACGDHLVFRTMVLH